MAGFGASGPQRRLVLGPVRRLRRRPGPRLRARGHAGHAPGHAGHRRRGRRARPRAEGIDCHFAKGGTVVAARSEAQRARALAEVAAARALGFGPDDLRWLGPAEAGPLIGVDGLLGATYTPHCAALQPALLARGLADAVERRGVDALRAHRGHRASTRAGDRGRPPVVRTRGRHRHAPTWWCAPSRPGRRPCRATSAPWSPVYSLMVATEPLGRTSGTAAGLGGRATFADHRHMIIYGQRTADGRIAFGGRGAPYHFGSAIRPAFDRAPASTPCCGGPWSSCSPPWPRPGFTHAWGGPLGIPRDWHSSVGPRPGQRPGLGRGLRGRRGLHHQPGRAHPGRPHHRGRHRPDPPALGQPPLPPLGTRTPALARRQRRAVDDEAGRPQRGPTGPAQPAGRPDGALLGH